MDGDHCERAAVFFVCLVFFYLCQVVQRIQDVPLDLELVLHQLSRQPALCLAAHVHHFAVHADADVSLTVPFHFLILRNLVSRVKFCLK